VNISFTQGQGSYPEHWKPAAVVPIANRVPTLTVSNYRPISIIAVMSKVIEKLVAE